MPADRDAQMMRAVVVALLVGVASAFVPPTAPARTSVAVSADATTLEGISPPVGFFDPLGLSKAVNE